jgi:probable HAF family extracellular repeat protein
VLRFTKLVLSCMLIGCLQVSRLHGQTLIDLGDFGGGFSEAFGINNSGQVVGTAATPGDQALGLSHAFLYSNGTMSNLGIPETLAADSYSYALAINSSGQIAELSGYAVTGGSSAYLYTNGTATNLGSLGGTQTGPAALNNSGQVVGYSYTNDGTGGAFLYSNGSLTNLAALGSLGAYSEATAINNSGEIAGDSNAGAFLYSNGNFTNLGSLGGGYSFASGINDNGQIVGGAGTGNGEDAFLYSNGTISDLGSLGSNNSFALAINNPGQVVGYVNLSGQQDAFLYTDAQMENLNTIYANLLVAGSGTLTGFTSLTEATGINDSGQIVGYGNFWNGSGNSTEAFLLNPVSVPEPSDALLLPMGLAVLWGRRRFLVKALGEFATVSNKKK